MPNLLKISIITPSFNQGQFIEETILSVLDQNYPELEYNIIDGGSTDNSIDIIKKYEKHLKYWISEKDKGQSHAINKGFKKSTGEIVAWLNSDDLYLKDTLKIVSRIFQENPDINLIYGDVTNILPDGTEQFYKVKEFNVLDFLSRISIHQPAVFWRRKIFDDIGYLDEDFHFTMDYDFWARVFLKYKTKKINQLFAKFRIHAESKSSDNPPEVYLESRIVLSKFFNSLSTDHYKNKAIQLKLYNNPGNNKFEINESLLENKLQKIYNTFIYNCAIQEYTFGDKKLARVYFIKALTFNSSLKIFYFLIRNYFKKQN